MPVYQLTQGPIQWRDGRYGTGEIIVDPPEFIRERFGDVLLRLDNGDGEIDREIAVNLPYSALQRIADANDSVPADADRDVLVDALSRDVQSETDEEYEDVEAAAARVVENLERQGSEEMYRDHSGDSDVDDEAVQAQKEEILDELESESESEADRPDADTQEE